MKTFLLKSILLFTALFFLWVEPVLADEVYQNSAVAAPQAMTLTVSNVGYNSLTLSWTANPDATKYKLWVKKEVSGGWETYAEYNGKEFGMTILTTDIVNVGSSFSTKRMVVLQAVRNTTVVEEVSKPFQVKLLPQNFSLLYTPGSTTISVEWNAFDDDYEYIVYAYKKIGTSLTLLTGYPQGFIFSQHHSPYTHKINGLDLGTKYEITVKTKFYGEWCDTLHKTQYTSPAIPQVTAATEIKANSFVANWKTTPVAPQYKLFVKETASGKTLLNGLVIDGLLKYKMENIDPGTQYEYQVTSVNPTGESGKSEVMKVITLILPTPVAISASSIASSYFEARWNTVAGASSYLLQLSDGNVWSNYPVSSGSASSMVITGLKPDFNYEYRIRAYFGTDYSKYSNVIAAKTLNGPVAKAASLQEDPTKATLVWDTFTGATGYKLWVLSNEGTANNPAGYNPKTLAVVTNHLISGLRTGHSYQFFLQAITSSGNSAESNKIDFFTLPATPVALDANEITGNSFNARWQVFDNVDQTYLSVFQSKNGAPVTGFNNKLVTNESETVTGLTFDTEYYFIVKVKKNGLFSFPSANKYLRTDYVQLNLTATPPSGGVATGDGWKKLNSGVTINATPAKGYEFVNWTKGTTPVSTSQSYSFNITANTSLTANFRATTTIYTLNLTSSPAAGGTVSGGGSFAQGTSVTVNASPAKGYEFVNWTEKGIAVSSSAAYTFTISASRILVANFREKATDLLLTLSASPVSGGSVSGGGRFAPGTNVSISALAAKGYEFVNWMEDRTVVSLSPNFKFSLTANRTLTANFRVVTGSYTLSLAASPVAGGTTGGAGAFTPGSTVTATATPNSGYDFVNWTEGATVVSTSANYPFALNANRTLTANFQQKVTGYTLSLMTNPEAGGTVSGGGAFTQGATVTAKAVASGGYEFVNWTEGSTVVSALATYPFTLNGNRTLTAHFEQVTPSFSVWLSASPEAGGSVSGEGTFSQGTSITISATPSSGYDFAGWTEESVLVSPSPGFTFPLNTSRVLTANFTLKTAISDQTQGNRIRIFPNPATDILNISGLKSGAVISLYGLNGAKIMTRRAMSNLEKIDISGMLKGLYLISVEENGMRLTNKITVR